MLGTVVESALGDPHRLHDQMAGDRPEAIEALALRQAIDGALHDLGEPPGRHVKPLGIARREEVPVAQVRGFAECGVSDIVRRQRQSADAQQGFAGFQVRHRQGLKASLFHVFLVVLQLADDAHRWHLGFVNGRH